MASENELLERATSFVFENWQLVLASVVIGAFTVKQRLAIKNRDEERCQVEDIIPHQHRGRIEVHHITPQAYHYANDSDPDYSENAIALCQEAHQRVHPDLKRALDNYRRGDKDSFKKMALEQQLDAT